MTTRTSNIEDIRRDLEAATNAQRMQSRLLLEYQTCLLAGDWAGADAMRVQITAAQESYLDHLMAAHRALRDA